MKIFDGVPVNPATLSPTWQGVLGVAMLLVNSFIEADKIRDERVAREQAQRQGPTTLSDVMEQSGLKIPHLHDALTTFMGGSEEAKAAATLIVNTPDPVKLLRDFAKQYTPASAANGPIVTPPSAAAPARPMPASPAPSATASQDAATSSPKPKPAAFRPEFTREGCEAADRAKAAQPRPKPAAFRPEFTREGLEATARAAATTPATSPSAPTAPAPAGSLINALAERLELFSQQMNAHQQELDTRIRCAEAELAALCEELENLRVFNDRPILFVVPSIDEEAPPTDAASPSEDVPSNPEGENVATVETDAGPAESAPPIAASPDPASPEPATAASEPVEPMATEAQVNDTAPPVEDLPPLVAGSPPLPSAASEADLARAFSMLGKFTDQAAAHYANEAERVRALERKISHMRGLVERGRGSAASRG
jgi:hypothetical protein